jgi:Bacterial DNA-binding protein
MTSGGRYAIWPPSPILQELCNDVFRTRHNRRGSSRHIKSASAGDSGQRVEKRRQGRGECDEVSLAGFGKFKVKASPEREGRNPANGEKIKIAASKKLSFSPAKAVKDVLKA